MFHRFQKLGLVLSSLALLFSVVAFSFHFHHEPVAKAPSHCSLCSVSGQAKLLTPSSGSPTPLVFETSHLISPVVSVFIASQVFQNVSPRAPPVA